MGFIPGNKFPHTKVSGYDELENIENESRALEVTRLGSSTDPNLGHTPVFGIYYFRIAFSWDVVGP